MKKLIAIDLDGTLLNTFKKIPDKNKEILKKVQDMGHIVMVATGRPYERALGYAKELEIDKYSGLLATYNGAVITDIRSGKHISDIKFDLDLLKKIISFIDGLKVDYSLYKGKKLYTNGHSKLWVKIFRKIMGQDVEKHKDFSSKIDFTVNKILLNDTKSKLKITKEKIEKEFGELVHVCFSSPVSIEVMPKGASKGFALKTVAQLFNIDMKDTIAFGNTGNDESMIKMAGVGVAVANSSKSLIEIADYVTLSNSKSGVGDYLEKFVLGEN